MISRAKTLDGEMVEGYLTKSIGYEKYWIENESPPTYKYRIDPSTLEYKIGDEWFSMEELEVMKLLYEPYVKSTDRVVKMSEDQFGAYMDWSMQNGYR